MLEEIDLLIGLAIESKETNCDPGAVVEKARNLNNKASAKLRKEIIVPLSQSRNPIEFLNNKCDEHLRRVQIKRGIHLT